MQGEKIVRLRCPPCYQSFQQTWSWAIFKKSLHFLTYKNQTKNCFRVPAFQTLDDRCTNFVTNAKHNFQVPWLQAKITIYLYSNPTHFILGFHPFVFWVISKKWSVIKVIPKRFKNSELFMTQPFAQRCVHSCSPSFFWSHFRLEDHPRTWIRDRITPPFVSP